MSREAFTEEQDTVSKWQVVWCCWLHKAALAEWHVMTLWDQAEARSLKVTDVKPSHVKWTLNVPADVGRLNPEMGELVITAGS